VALLKERDDLKKLYEGIDPDTVKALVEEKRAEEEKLLSGSPTPHPSPLPSAEREKIEKLVENRIKSVKADLRIWRSGEGRAGVRSPSSVIMQSARNPLQARSLFFVSAPIPWERSPGRSGRSAGRSFASP
jgi:hypothetical protein